MRNEEYHHMIPANQQETKQYADTIISTLKNLLGELVESDPLTQRRIQNLLMHAGLTDWLLNKLLKKLENKEFYYRELF